MFGHLLTGSNFNDSISRLTNGSHGFGAKLTNIFSKEFIVETGDKHRGLHYRQVWRNNMEIKEEAVISPLGDKKDFTRVTFIPDLSSKSNVNKVFFFSLLFFFKCRMKNEKDILIKFC